jgi:hypothetical protein
LLSVSKLVRSETYDVLYYENMFTCDVHDFHFAPVLLAQRKVPYADSLTGIGDPDAMIDSSNRNWKNLGSWLHTCRRGECTGWSAKVQGNDDDAEDNLLQGLFHVAIACPSTCPEALEVLEQAMRPALVSLNPD